MENLDVGAWRMRLHEVMAGVYFRSFQSSMVRGIQHGDSKREVMARARAELEGPLYGRLRRHLSEDGRVAKDPLCPIGARRYQRSLSQSQGDRLGEKRTYGGSLCKVKTESVKRKKLTRNTYFPVSFFCKEYEKKVALYFATHQIIHDALGVICFMGDDLHFRDSGTGRKMVVREIS